MVFLASSRHPLAHGGDVTLSEVLRYPFVIPAPMGNCHTTLRRLAAVNVQMPAQFSYSQVLVRKNKWLSPALKKPLEIITAAEKITDNAKKTPPQIVIVNERRQER